MLVVAAAASETTWEVLAQVELVVVVTEAIAHLPHKVEPLIPEAVVEVEAMRAVLLVQAAPA
jgi:hypothetical protein